MGNAELDEAQAGIKIARRNTNNLNMQMTPPLWQSEEELRILLLKLQEENEKAGLKLSIK